jgi:hypothetical protein
MTLIINKPNKSKSKIKLFLSIDRSKWYCGPYERLYYRGKKSCLMHLLEAAIDDKNYSKIEKLLKGSSYPEDIPWAFVKIKQPIPNILDQFVAARAHGIDSFEYISSVLCENIFDIEIGSNEWWTPDHARDVNEFAVIKEKELQKLFMKAGIELEFVGENDTTSTCPDCKETQIWTKKVCPNCVHGKKAHQ